MEFEKFGRTKHSPIYELAATFMDTPYYFGGYYLLRPKSIDFGSDKGKLTQTTSACINDALVDTWVYSWSIQSKKMLEQVAKDFQIDDTLLSQIQTWADKKFELGKLQWVDNFTDLETALEFKHTFLNHISNVHIYSIYLSSTDCETLIQEFKNDKENQGDFGLRQNLLQKIEEKENLNEVLLGYDLIGVEIGGTYHTFYCNNATEELIDKFNLSLNENGLFNEIDDWTNVKKYLNDEKNGFEPVPWYVAKTKQVTE